MKLMNNLVRAVLLAAMSRPALAAGFSTAQSVLEKVETGLMGLAIIVITIATMWVGYRVLWDGKSLADCKNIIIGGILIGGAAEIGSLLAGANA